MNSLDSVKCVGHCEVPETRTIILECVGPNEDRFTLECMNSFHGVHVVMGASGVAASKSLPGCHMQHESTGLIFDDFNHEVKQLVHGLSGKRAKLCFQNLDVILDFSQDIDKVVKLSNRVVSERTGFFEEVSV